MDPGRNLSDFLLIVAILALCLFAVHHNFSKEDASNPAEGLLAPGTQGMDRLWRDSVKAQERSDMRPAADPKIVWKEPEPAWKEVSQVEEAAEPEETEEIKPEEVTPVPAEEEDPRIAKLTEAYNSGKISKELYEKNLARFKQQK